MPFTYFIADIHLSEHRPDITACLMAFLEQDAPQAEALYVLGDLFEVWIGDDDVTPFSQNVAAAFKAVSKHLPVYFIHGNRDFAIREGWARQAGMTILKEQTVIDLYGEPTLITHGDELCTRDVAYQKFRRKSRSWWWPRMMLALPLRVRRKIAQRGREKSRENQKHLRPEIMDVTQSEVEYVMRQHNVNQLIHGHTHRPNIHAFTLQNKLVRRIVLGDWYDQGSILQVSKQGIQLEQRKFST